MSLQKILETKSLSSATMQINHNEKPLVGIPREGLELALVFDNQKANKHESEWMLHLWGLYMHLVVWEWRHECYILTQKKQQQQRQQSMDMGMDKENQVGKSACHYFCFEYFSSIYCDHVTPWPIPIPIHRHGKASVSRVDEII